MIRGFYRTRAREADPSDIGASRDGANSDMDRLPLKDEKRRRVGP